MVEEPREDRPWLNLLSLRNVSLRNVSLRNVSLRNTDTFSGCFGTDGWLRGGKVSGAIQ